MQGFSSAAAELPIDMLDTARRVRYPRHLFARAPSGLDHDPAVGGGDGGAGALKAVGQY